MATSLDPDPDTLAAWTAEFTSFVHEHLTSLDDQPASDVDGASELAATFREPLPEQGRPLGELLKRLDPAVKKSFNTAGPGYLAFVPGGGLPSSALSTYLAASVNRYMGVAKAAPVLSEIEATTLGWLAQSMGYPDSARGILTTGGSISNLAAVFTARVARLGDDFGRAVIYASRDTHASFAKAARITGFRANQISVLDMDARRRLQPETLARAVEHDREDGRIPFLVAVNAGTTNTGAVDPIDALADVTDAQGLWLHADAAYGGFFRWVDPDLVAGLERADSIALDPHKGLFLPYGSGCLLVRDGEALRRAHQSDADYMRDVRPDAGQTNFTDLSPELSRSFRGLAIWLPLMLHGAEAFRQALREKLDLARYAADELGGDARFEVIDPPQLSIVAFRLRDRDNGANHALLERVNARRRVFLSATDLDGRTTLRICVLSFRSHKGRVDEALSLLREEAARV